MGAPYDSDERMSDAEWQAYLHALPDDELDGLCETGVLVTARLDAQDERDRRRYEAEGA